jgi:hypothetical protein
MQGTVLARKRIPIVGRAHMDGHLNIDHFMFQCVVCKDITPVKKMYITTIPGCGRLCPACYTELINLVTEILNRLEY